MAVAHKFAYEILHITYTGTYFQYPHQSPVSVLPCFPGQYHEVPPIIRKSYTFQL